MKVLVTGAAGFIGRNLVVRLREARAEVLEFVRGNPETLLDQALLSVDVVVHLAGENRPKSPVDFSAVNVGLTRRICDAVRASQRSVPILFASSTQAELANPYGESKLRAEQELRELAAVCGNPVAIYRLPGVFGKWSKPNYNSVVATFSHNIANELPIRISDSSSTVRLVYIDDVVDSFITWMQKPGDGLQRMAVAPEYQITLGDLAKQIEAFRNCRSTLAGERVGTGLVRALYATYVSFLPTGKFSYGLPSFGDARGVFVEMLKTPDAGQFSFFTAHPGVSRGGHYHHTKTEKFLVLKGTARFGFRNIVTGETHCLFTSGKEPQVVDSIPGWAHDITNIGDEELVVMLWANEVYDRMRPDTTACKV